jgi:hypothetical protein
MTTIKELTYPGRVELPAGTELGPTSRPVVINGHTWDPRTRTTTVFVEVPPFEPIIDLAERIAAQAAEIVSRISAREDAAYAQFFRDHA